PSTGVAPGRGRAPGTLGRARRLPGLLRLYRTQSGGLLRLPAVAYSRSRSEAERGQMSAYLDRVAERITDPTERALWIAQQRAGDAYEAATDGALHHA